ncbi:GGDEF domain-containing protein [Pseudonocardia asaccharolytica]|uniref:GGDEF domain-containing protein n=1 Tax=Pseudonocardia asaccharolytica DSM 44247 = NBRC 16224 TaxID=1123024 RepID=A0A511CYG9_9PSEU|nr:GGDEF domain-containing protein [Pseudonocardia asaccharolytica]GEL17609.1 GGDEF domain-containing protein [Pseudonocardia asaccharolytica DSM 44247 = NBRC 16224]
MVSTATTLAPPQRHPVPARWPFWTLRAPAIAAVVLVEATAIVLLALGVAGPVPATGALGLTALLIALGVVHTEVATGIERIRRRSAGTSYFDLSSVWTFAAAVLLPPAMAGLVVLGIYAHLWWRVWRPAKVPLYRHLFTTATVLLAARAAHAVVAGSGGFQGWPESAAGLGTIALAILVYVTLNTVLVALAIVASSGRAEPAAVLGHWDGHMLEVATLCLGALAAIVLTTRPMLVVLALPPLLVLHRSVLVRQLETEASTDAKTGLLNAAAWRARTEQELHRVRRARDAVAVLIADLDHFKAVNDSYGHLAGDAVLAAVAGELRAQVRADDLVGRFGGEEFVVLAALSRGGDGRRELHAIAERIRHRIAALSVVVDTPEGAQTLSGLSISVGGATCSTDGAGLDRVLANADAALYAAKNAGRNTVRIAGPAEVPAARRPIA